MTSPVSGTDSSAPCIVTCGPRSPGDRARAPTPFHGERPVARITSTPDSEIRAIASRTAGSRQPAASSRVPSMSQARRRGRIGAGGPGRTAMQGLLRAGAPLRAHRAPDDDLRCSARWRSGSTRDVPSAWQAVGQRQSHGGCSDIGRWSTGRNEAPTARAGHHQAPPVSHPDRGNLRGRAIPPTRITVHVSSPQPASMSISVDPRTFWRQ